MTEPEQAKALQAAFPTEPARDALRQRVENLTPLAPIVARPRLKFRHVFGIVAFLWIGHNVPAAVRVWETELTGRYHQQDWMVNEQGKTVLVYECWSDANNTKMCTYEIPGTRRGYISILKNDETLYNYDKKTRILKIKPYRDSTRKLHKLNKYLEIATLCLLRIRDTRPIQYINGHPSIVREYDSKHKDIHDLVSDTYSTWDDKGRLISMTRREPIPDSVFEPNFPEATQTIYLPADDEPTPSDAQSLFRTLGMQVRTYLFDQHP